MEPLLAQLIKRVAPKARRKVNVHIPEYTPNCRVSNNVRVHASLNRGFGTSVTQWTTGKTHAKDPFVAPNVQDNSYSQPAANLSQDVGEAEANHFQHIEEHSKKKQRESPWTREGSAVPPVSRNREASAMAKGKLLTTPSRMLKFIIPLSPNDTNKDRKDVEPLALLVHPQQPLSYLERLIQSELPVLDDGKPPSVTFRAEDTAEGDEELDSEGSVSKDKGKDKGQDKGKEIEIEEEEEEEEVQDEEELSAEHKTRIGGKVTRTGKLNSSKKDVEQTGPKSSEPTPEDEDHPNFVRWSTSTEIGDFIRDAARGKEFALDIKGAGTIYVGVPSFTDRTYYLRMRLRKTSKKIMRLADVKKECDDLAQKGARRVAQGGFGALIGWWGLVYYLTFRTDLGWDVMEPVTYLVGLSGLIGGYMWFLYHNREVSYRSAMHFTVSRRQSQLYEQKGFNVNQWDMLVEEGNRLRREIKMIAEEYDVEWDEKHDEGDERVTQALKEERKKSNNGEKKEKKDKDDEDSDE